MDAFVALFQSLRRGLMDVFQLFAGAFPAVGVEEEGAQRLAQEVDRVVQQVFVVELARR